MSDGHTMAQLDDPQLKIDVSFQPVSGITSLEAGPAPSCVPSEVSVWGVILDGSPTCLDRCLGWLNQDERIRAERFVRDEDRRRFIFAHGCVRSILGRYLDMDPARIEFLHGDSGKPSVSHVCIDGLPMSFNLSHAGGRALIAISRGREVGIDLEHVRAEVEVEKLAGRYFAHSERVVINGLEQQDRGARFFRYWVCKEAVLKAQGLGLQALSQCEILLGTNGISAEVVVPLGSQLKNNWNVRLLACGEGWEAAVVSEGTDWIVQTALGR